MVDVTLPNNGWRPRKHQMAIWSYLENGGRHAELVAHRRFGKDEVCLHWAAIAAMSRPATYWHMLPMASQARKAIWEAVNPHSGIRRIDEAFPLALRSTTRENEMMIRFKNGSTWQVLGSDNFNSLVGSPPAGVVFSEWALANPAARAYIRPILAENNGWQLYITTPRGKNHAHDTFQSALKTPGSFAQILPATVTGVFTAEQLEAERDAYRADFGIDVGDALYRQEFLCDWDAAILGAFYGHEMRQALDEGRICDVDWQPGAKVHTAWDLGRTDDTAIWFYQRIRGEIHLIDYYAVSGADVPDIATVVLSKPYEYGDHYLPHDARMKTLASNGRSIIEQLHILGVKGRIVPEVGIQNGIQAARAMLPVCWFDETRCAAGIEALRQYHRVWDAERRMFSEKANHDSSSHAADAFRMLGVAWREETPDRTKSLPRHPSQVPLDTLWKKRPGTARIQF